MMKTWVITCTYPLNLVEFTTPNNYKCRSVNTQVGSQVSSQGSYIYHVQDKMDVPHIQHTYIC